jgi:hypothetical protein
MTTNYKTERNGIDWLIDKLKSDGWDVTREHKKGFDLRIQRNEVEQLIEVKTTEKPYFTRRWLEEKEYEVMMANPSNYYVYLITQASSSPSLQILGFDEVMRRKVKESRIYWFDFKF